MNVKHATIHSYWLMFVATVITVGIVTSSQLVTNRISLLLDRQASELLAADLVILSGKKFDAEYQAVAREQGLQVSRSVSLRTAVFIDDEPQLVELKAVDAAYPLRGKLERAHEVTAPRSYAEQGPSVGEVWLDSKLAPSVGQELTLGEQAFAASWLLTYEPDRGGAIFNLAPRVLMNIEDLAQTGLVVPGSRVRYRLMFAGDQADIASFKTWLTINLKSGEEVQDLENARPEMRRALERTRKFFALAIVLTLVIAMAAIAITARYTANREAPKIAMLRAFGISQRSLFKYYLGQLGWLWIAATVVGVMLGWATQFPLQWALDGWFGKTLPQVYSLRPYLTAALVGLLALAGFSLPYLLNATATPPMQVLRTVVNRRSWSRGLLMTGSAIIAEQGREGEFFKVGDRVQGRARLSQVYSDKVILDNSGKLETLTFEDAAKLMKGIKSSKNKPKSTSKKPKTASSKKKSKANFKRQLRGIRTPEKFVDFAKDQLEDPVQAMENMGLKSAGDGYLLTPSATMLMGLGMKAGDKIISVNGYPLGDPVQDKTIIDEVYSTGNASIVIERGSRRMTINHSF